MIVTNDVPRVYGRDTRSPVLLIEGERTNSNQHGISLEPWSSKNNADIESNVIVAPDGTPTGDKLIATTTSQPRREIRRVSVEEPTTISWSIFAKRGDSPFSALSAYSANAMVLFNLDTGDVQSASGNHLLGYGMSPAPGGWYRTWISVIVNPNEPHKIFKVHQTAGPGTSDGVIGGYVYYWGGQLEENSKFPSSHILTDGNGSVTRTADTYTLSGIPIVDGPKTINIAGYLDNQRPAGSKHYWWTHAGSSWIRQDGNRLEVSIENLPLYIDIPESGWLPVTLSDDGNETQVWVDGELKGTLDASIKYHANELYTPLDTEEFAFTYLAFGAAEMQIPFIKPHEDASNVNLPVQHQEWVTELEKIGVTYGT